MKRITFILIIFLVAGLTSSKYASAQNVTIPTTAVSFPRDVIDKDGGTIDFYGKLSGFSGSIPSGGCTPYFFSERGTDYYWLLGFNSNDGLGGGGLTGYGSLGGYYNASTGNFGSWSYEQLFGAGQVDQWHHYKLVWDKDGLLGNIHRRMILYVDDVINSQYWLDWPNQSLVDLTEGTLNLISTGNPGCGTLSGLVAVDEFKVYDRSGNLVLYNSLGSETEIENSITGPNGSFNGGGNAHFIPGLVGNAVEANPVSGYGYAPPTITSFSPTSGPIGTTVIIYGTNFSSTLANNIVYFGATKATVTAATSTSLTVKVPLGATYQPITVTVNNLTAYSAQPFVVTFEGGGSAFTSTSFAPKVDISLDYNPGGFNVGDFDGDGKTDMVSGNFSTSTISVFRNLSSNGNISFAPRIDYSTGGVVYSCAIGDIDGDGKLDIVTGNYDANSVSVFRNTSTPGNISFAPKADFTTGIGTAHEVIRDLDGDGKPEIIVANDPTASFSVLRNTSTPGNISFEAKQDFITPAGVFMCATGDLNGDGKPDIVTGGEGPSNTFSVFQNTSTLGNISFAASIDYTTYSDRKGVAIGDLDGDGKPDLAISNFNNPANSLSVFRNTSSGGAISFAPKVDYSTGGTGSDVASISDLDGDGKPDLILNNYWNSNISLFRNIGSSGNILFADKVDFPTGSGPRWFYGCDIDGDGRPDIALDNLFSETISVLRNQIGVGTTCTVPSGLATTNITGTTAKLNWVAVNGAVGYAIRYRVTGSNQSIFKTTINSKKLTGLTPNTSYTWQVKTYCSLTPPAVGSDWSSSQQFTTGSLKLADEQPTTFNVYPNPTTGQFTIAMTLNEEVNSPAIIQVINSLGQIMYTEKTSVANGMLQKEIKLNNLPAGMYYVKVIVNDQVYSAQLSYSK